LNATGQVQLERTGNGQAAHPQPTGELPRGDDVALFLHTSGTTSRPKGVPLTHANLMASIRNIVATYALTPEDTSLIVMPLFHVHGLIGATLSTLLSGGTVIVPTSFSATKFWPAVQEHGATWYSAVPTIHQILLSRADADNAPRSGLRFIRSCSSALAPAVFAQLEERFGAPVLEAYGMTEASHQMSSNPLPAEGARKPGSVGRGTGVEIVILDESGNRLPSGQQGEVSIRGPNVMHGYRNNPDANASSFTGGYFRTGDRGFLDAGGYLTLTGRLKELINRGGEKISPLEVDAVLLEHPAVAEAVSFGVPDPKYGEEVHGAVVLKTAAQADEIVAFCRDRLADFKVPKRIYIADALPRTATGKIQRRHVAAHFLKVST
jgi:acyl-CoA synthetase (AMP-forming)/AMP-acid ligase II